MTDVFEALMSRRSAGAKFLRVPGPDEAALHRILLAASRAPDHGRLVPFRFVVIAGNSRERFADVLGKAAAAERPGLAAEEIERAREKAFQGPCLVALIARINANHPKIPASDQWLTVGCALENLLLATAACGFGAAVRSGRYLETAPVRAAFGLAEDEQMTCFIAIGSASEWPPAKPKPDLAAIVSDW